MPDHVSASRGASLFSLDGRTAFVSGSSRGLGLCIARGLAEAGARVVLNGVDEERLDESRRGMAAAGHDVAVCALDVTDARAVEARIPRLLDEVGQIDILFNNAGINLRGPLHEYPVSDWDRMLQTNLSSVFYLSRALVPGMIERRRGKIVNTCSLMSEVGRKTTAPYAATKGAVKMLTRAMAVEWGGYDIQVNGIGPGYFATEMTRPLQENPEFDAWLRDRTPQGRWGVPEELVGVSVFLASAASNFVNGQIIYVDGGVLAKL